MQLAATKMKKVGWESGVAGCCVVETSMTKGNVLVYIGELKIGGNASLERWNTYLSILV